MSTKFFQESIDEAIALLEQSLSLTKKKPKIEKQRTAFDLIEQLSGILGGLKRQEEREFATLVQYTNEFLRSLQSYEMIEDKSAIIGEMEPVAKAIAFQAQKIASLSEEPKTLRSKSFLDLYLKREKFSEEKTKQLILKHAFLQWKEKEAQEFSLLINYIDNYI